MPTFEKNKLLAQLKEDVREIISKVQRIPADNMDILNRQPGYNKWSVAQVLAHLNFYNKTYLPHLEKRLMGTDDHNNTYKSGWLGNYFTKVMQPGVNGEVANKMSSPKDARPASELIVQQVFQEFISGQKRLLQLLDKAENSNLNKRIPTSISKLIKMKAGDTFRFLIAHQQRHMTQIERTLAAVSG